MEPWGLLLKKAQSKSKIGDEDVQRAWPFGSLPQG
jgi:hypothetical protein